MADVLDVQNRIAADITAVVNPLAGTVYTPPVSADDVLTGPQTCGSTQVFPGKQLLRTIMTRLELGKNQIGVNSDQHEIRTDQFQDLPTYIPNNVTQPVPLLSFTLSANATVATMGGAIQAGDVIGATLGSKGAGYAVLASDTLNSIAAGLGAALTNVGILNSVTAASVTILSAGEPQWSTGTSWTVEQEVWRRRKIFYADLHAVTPYEMQYIGRFVESMYSLNTVLTLPVDGTYARVMSMDTIDFLDQQRDGAYLRRFRWLIDFITTQQSTVTQVVAVADYLTGLIPGSTIGSSLALDTSGALDTQGAFDSAAPPTTIQL